MKEVKILEVEKEVLKRIDMICRFACCKYTIKQGSIINIKGSNIAYVSPHIITIKENNYLKEINNDLEQICQKLSKLYTVSKEVILRKAIDNNYCSSGIYQILVDKWNDELNSIPKRKPMGNFYNNKLTYLGKNYVSVVLKEYFNHSISYSQASNYLMIQPKNFSEFSNRFRGDM